MILESKLLECIEIGVAAALNINSIAKLEHVTSLDFLDVIPHLLGYLIHTNLDQVRSSKLVLSKLEVKIKVV